MNYIRILLAAFVGVLVIWAAFKLISVVLKTVFGTIRKVLGNWIYAIEGMLLIIVYAALILGIPYWLAVSRGIELPFYIAAVVFAIVAIDEIRKIVYRVKHGHVSIAPMPYNPYEHGTAEHELRELNNKLDDWNR